MRKQHARLDAIMRMILNCDSRLVYMSKHKHYNDLIARTSRVRNRLYSSYTNQLTKMFQDVLWTRPEQTND
jgi:hypothetical protein